MKTSSRGKVTINSTDTADNPVVDVNWLSTTTDQQLAIEGLRRARVLANSFGVVDGPEVIPGDSIQTDEQILNFIRQTVAPSHHAVATCRFDSPRLMKGLIPSIEIVFFLSSLFASSFLFLSLHLGQVL